MQHKEYKAIWVPTELHKKFQARAEKNKRTMIAELEMMLGL